MKIIPIINQDFVSRYQRIQGKVIDTLTNKTIIDSSEVTAETLLQKLNRIGMLNGHIIDSNARLPKEKQAKLLYLVA